MQCGHRGGRFEPWAEGAELNQLGVCRNNPSGYQVVTNTLQKLFHVPGCTCTCVGMMCEQDINRALLWSV